jgi:hypothetical protein
VPPTHRRRFDHLFTELSVAAGELVPRYALWLCVQELGWDPVRIEADEVVAFVDDHLDAFLAEHDLFVPPRARRRLRRSLRRFDPRRPAPEEILERIFPAAR